MSTQRFDRVRNHSSTHHQDSALGAFSIRPLGCFLDIIPDFVGPSISILYISKKLRLEHGLQSTHLLGKYHQ